MEQSLDFEELVQREQVAQRTTIAHLTASHRNIFNSAQVKDFLIGQGQLTPRFMVGSSQISHLRLYSCPCYLQESRTSNKK